MALDPLGHMRIAVSDFDASQKFYDTLLTKLGYRKVSEKGWVGGEGFGIWIMQAAHPEHRYVFESPGLHHLCLKVETKEEVDRMHDFLLASGVFIVAPPQEYPQYTQDYYAVFFSDPDGIELEIAYY